MSTRLPDGYYTNQTLEGQVSQTSGAQEAPLYYQGDDLDFEVYLTVNGVPVDPTFWHITVGVKKNKYAQDYMFYGKFGSAIYKKQPVGFYRVFIPHTFTRHMKPGTYFMDIKVNEFIGASGDFKDTTLVIYNTAFQIDLSTLSPHPHLVRRWSEETISLPSCIGVETPHEQYRESTIPQATDITRA